MLRIDHELSNEVQAAFNDASGGSDAHTLEVLTTCPPSASPMDGSYLDRVVEAARWSEDAGCTGILVYTDNTLLDPWLIAQNIIQRTSSITPLVAVQPVYLSPYAAARMTVTIACLTSRKISINLVTGGSATHLRALGDAADHDLRYERLLEYAETMLALLSSVRPVVFQGRYYSYEGARMPCPLPASLMPRFYVSGSSAAGRAVAAGLGVTRLEYPLAPTEYDAEGAGRNENWGLRIGVITRPDSAEAWEVARARFPVDAAGEQLHRVTSRMSDSHWYAELTASPSGHGKNPYWLYPFRTYKTFCPYLVGSYDEVAGVLRQYLALGIRTMILDVPTEPADLAYTWAALERAGHPRMPPQSVARLSQPGLGRALHE